MPSLRRTEISWNEKFRRCFYFFLRDELDGLLINEALIESYKSFKAGNQEYPFVEMRELKPRAKIIGEEYASQKHFMLIFSEETLPGDTKHYVRFFDSNRVTKENLGSHGVFDIQEVFHQRMRFFEDKDFARLIHDVLQCDFAALIQRDQTIRTRYRFGISHFHVRIDWPVADAAQDLGRYLRYISKDIYEKGERIGELLQQKLYEYYGFHHTVGGRRTGALVAAQFMTRFDHISTVYVASAETRTLSRLSERGVAKFVLIAISNEDMKELARQLRISESDFAAEYLIDRTPGYGVGLFQVTYLRNEHSTPPPDGKLRDLNPDFPWLRVDAQLLCPPPWNVETRPIQYSRIYA